ncbi:helix-turn-helix transcriptional regulator [Actinomadura rudentiformis]|uniref:LuxR family transcriptional regulator n=1 Tax=Actinomadura rudentiformis TaxID=359158 RepID=A0A6H9Z1L9_9ACTN|nr:LuxR C-terminal-related transcriptional regulator [Actinomadura rudentiformis]KAB2347984.1 LuxR family transcriptional regulator [Actinomadura rudentiformis]
MTEGEPRRESRRTATFLLTEVESAMPLWDMAPDSADAAIALHYEVIDSAVRAHGGVRAGGIGSGHGVQAMFESAAEAVAAALAVQLALARQDWPAGLAVRVRIGVHTTEERGQHSRGYSDVAAHRCARVRDVAHGGQILLTAATASLVADALPEAAWLADLGPHRLRDLLRPERLYELRHSDLSRDFPPVRSLDVVPNNLPAQLSSFVGRAEELATVRRLLEGQRLVTLTGAGGCGKSRLAVQAAAAMADQWPDGVWWIEVGGLGDGALVAELTAATLRVLVEPAGGPMRALTTQLRGRRLLVCLDTCEHLLDACADLTGGLLRACPEVSVLATSREPLGVLGETVWRVPSLAGKDAVRLFADRAALVQPEASGLADDPAVATICGRLDGIPLAIELAAAWVRALSPAQIAAGLDDRFRLLISGRRDTIARHRTLAASVDWSYDLLEEPDRVVFRRLAVFGGDFDLAAAQAVCAVDQAGDSCGEADTLTVIGHLVDKSLLVVDNGAGEARFRMLDTIRDYARRRLADAGETAAACDRHIGYFLNLAEAAAAGIDHDQDRWCRTLEAEHDNIRDALGWALGADDPERGRRLAAAMGMLWFLHGHLHGGRGILEQAIQLAPEDRSVLQGRLLAGMALMGMAAGDPLLTGDAARRGLDIAIERGDDALRGRCLALLAYAAFYHDFPTAVELADQAKTFSLPAGDDFTTDFAMMVKAFTLHEQDRHAESLELARRTFSRAHRRGDRFSAAFTRNCESFGVFFGGDVRRAVELAIEATHIAEGLADSFTVANLTVFQAWFICLSGDLEGGRRLLEPIARQIEDAGLTEISWLAWGLGKLHLYGGDFEGAAKWAERGGRFAVPTSDNRVACMAQLVEVAAARRLGQRDQARARAERAAALARAIGAYYPLADALEELAHLAAADDPARAEDLHHEALAIRLEHKLRPFYVDSLEALAALAARSQRSDKAVRLLAACEAAREEMGYARAPVNQPAVDETLAAALDALGGDAFATAKDEGSALSLDTAVEYATRARGARARPSSGWASLTPAERQVVRLVTDGLTNPEIAKRLFVTRATVKTHLSHIFAKLDVTNRTELTGLASRATRDQGSMPD